MRITSVHIDEVDPEDWESLKNDFTLGSRGRMCAQMNYLKHMLTVYPKNHFLHESRAIIARTDGGEIMGWSLVFPIVIGGNALNPGISLSCWGAYVFVHPMYRRRSIGRFLVNRVRRYKSDAYFYPHDETSGYFFMHLKQKQDNLNFQIQPEKFLSLSSSS